MGEGWVLLERLAAAEEARSWALSPVVRTHPRSPPCKGGRSEWWRAGDHPADDREGDRQANQRNPPFAGPHRFSSCRGSAPGDHRFGQMLAAQVIDDDRRQ